MASATILITNFNHGRFVGQAIESALAQTHEPLEVVVVDDGSNDDSRSVIATYGGSIKSIYKDNGGQASAINAGVQAAEGSCIYFLDADDVYAPDVVARSIGFFESRAVKVHWPYQPIDAAGRLTGRGSPAAALGSGDLRDMVRRMGPGTHTYPPSSANAATRCYLADVLPLPEDAFRTGADMYISELAAFAGPIAIAPEALTFYRRHDANDSTSVSGALMVDRWQGWYEACASAAEAYCRGQGLSIDRAAWAGHGWPSRLRDAVRSIGELIPAGDSFLLIDDNAWGLTGDLPGAVPFTSREGVYWGPPGDEDAAITELELRYQQGIGHVALLWNAAWWRDHYRRAFAWLDEHSERREIDGVVTVYHFR